jgi:hypothetical protein
VLVNIPSKWFFYRLEYSKVSILLKKASVSMFIWSCFQLYLNLQLWWYLRIFRNRELEMNLFSKVGIGETCHVKKTWSFWLHKIKKPNFYLVIVIKYCKKIIWSGDRSWVWLFPLTKQRLYRQIYCFFTELEVFGTTRMCLKILESIKERDGENFT